jgi:serine phosphatase RsbU (regulator of sigma subunit)/HAMP domain-containing protein
MTDTPGGTGGKRRRFVRLQTKFGITLTILGLFASALLASVTFQVSKEAVKAGVRRRLGNIVGLAVMQIDADAHSRIQVRADEAGPEYAAIRRQLQRIKAASADIGYVETVRVRPDGTVLWIVDADTTELMVHVGEVNETASPVFTASADTIRGVFVEPDYYEDQWGRWLSGYAPLYSSDGRRDAFLQVDLSAEQVSVYARRFRWLALGAFFVMGLVSPVVGFWLGGRMARSIVHLTDGAKRIAAGDLDSKVSVASRDEVEELANAFNVMTDELKVYMRNLAETTAAQERLDSELRIARDIQGSMLPRVFPPFPEHQGFDIFASMEPAKEVAGDFYDFFIVGDSQLCFIIADVTGKGVPASLFMVRSKTLLKTEALRGLGPHEVLGRVNDLLAAENDACYFVTVFCVVLDLRTGEIEYANGGHNPPFICRDGGEFEFLDVPKGFVVGPMPEMAYQSKKLVLQANDCLFLYTDGVTEAMNPQSQQFTEARLKETLSGLRERGLEDLVHGVRTRVLEFAEGAEQSDDITMLALRFHGRES